MPNHRPDIEGLRAVAVIAVILFHLGFETVSGGFIGVDIFFVISGFLIGGIVVREVQAGQFSFGGYLFRRVKRIVPVMLLVLFSVTLAACLVLMSQELEGYAWSLGFSALFLGNFHFWLHRGAYAESEHEVLLHMWTLGVEGQFYVLLPVIVLGLMRFGKAGLWPGLVLIAFASAAVSLLYPGASFYMLPARLWEFLLGALIAITPLPFVQRRWARETLAIIGLGLILYAAIAFHSDTPFPGWRAAIPCLGTAAIIAAGSAGPSLVSQLLEAAPMRFVGKISYSLYLWHWPVIVLLLLGLPAAELSAPLQALALALSLGLSVLSWKFVEEPFRRGAWPARPLLLASSSLTALLVAISLALSLSSGWPQRLSERGQDIASAMDYPLRDVFRSGECFIHHRSQTLDETACLLQSKGRARILVLGDSHAAHLVPGLAASFPQSAISQVTAAGCRPVLDQPASDYPYCSALMDQAYRTWVSEYGADLVVLAGRWEERDISALGDTLAGLKAQGREVLLVGPVAEWAQFVPRLLAIGHERGMSGELADAMQLEERQALDQRLAILAGQTGTDYVSLHSLQCADTCAYFDTNGAPLIVDNSHFSLEASKVFASQFEHGALRRAVD